MKSKYTGNSFKEHYDSIVKNNPKMELEIQLEMAKADLAELIFAYREKRQMTQKQLAEELGVRQQVISRIESGTNNITLDTLLRILEVLHISLKVHVAKRVRHQKILQFISA